MKKLIFVLLFISSNSYAYCFCACSNGEGSTICTQPLEIANMVCPDNC